MITGGCLCGAVRYAVEGEPSAQAVCHCRNCQRQTGSAFSVLVAVPRAALTLNGTPQTFVDQGDSGAAVHRHFCGACGSPIYTELPSAPAVVYLKAGTMDEPRELAPRVHVWCDSAWSWPGVPENAIRFGKGPPVR